MGVTCRVAPAEHKYICTREVTVTDEEITNILTQENEEFKAFFEEHSSLKAKLAEIKEKVHLTPEEELEKKDMQKLKLAKKDKMAEMVREYKQAHA